MVSRVGGNPLMPDCEPETRYPHVTAPRMATRVQSDGLALRQTPIRRSRPAADPCTVLRGDHLQPTADPAVHRSHVGRRRWPAWSWLLFPIVLLAGCARESGISEIPAIDLTIGDGTIRVPANRAWTHTGVVVRAGEPLTVVATGAVSYADNAPDHAGPEGTYLFGNDVVDRQFPLASAGDGPAPCYGLIGRIGDSQPFFIGRNKSWKVDASGPLYLGINDFEVSDNVGQFEVRVHKPQTVQPVRFERTIHDTHVAAGPVPHARVVVIYVDGLRPDVVREMAAMGQLPRIQ